MIKLVTYFVKEIVFDNKEEGDFRSSKFNPRKFILFMFSVACLLITPVIMMRAVEIAKENRELILKIEQHVCKIQQDASSDSSSRK